MLLFKPEEKKHQNTQNRKSQDDTERHDCAGRQRQTDGGEHGQASEDAQ